MAIYVKDVDISRPSFLGSEPWHVRRLTDATVILGRNGSGKSALLRGFRDLAQDTRHYVSPERGGDIAFKEEFVSVQFHGGNRAISSRGNTAPNFGEEAGARILAYLTNRGAQRGDNIVAPPEELERLISSVLPNLEFTIRGSITPYRIQRLDGRPDVTAVQDLSSGEAQLLKLAIDVVTVCAIWELDSQDERVLLIDEPDLHLHPDYQQRLATFIFEVIDTYKTQVIVATHSTTLLAALGHRGGNRTSVIYLEDTPRDLRATPFNENVLLMTSCLGGHVLMGPLFGARILLVEGDDEYQIWSQVPRHPGAPALAVVPCGGRPEMRRDQRILEQLFRSTLDHPVRPVGIALVDSDGRTVPQATAENPQDFVPFFSLACHESENLYLTDEVLEQIGLDWATAAARIKASAEASTIPNPKLVAVESWNRKQDDIKDVINSIVDALDPEHRVPWTKRVGKAIGKARPTGQLAEFLSPEFVDALWPL